MAGTSVMARGIEVNADGMHLAENADGRHILDALVMAAMKEESSFQTRWHPKLNKAMLTAWNWLMERGGSGVVDHYGRVMASGEVATGTSAETWLRLVAAGMLTGEHGRIAAAREDDHR
jgi:hypothetical protein